MGVITNGFGEKVFGGKKRSEFVDQSEGSKQVGKVLAVIRSNDKTFSNLITNIHLIIIRIS